MLFFYLKWSFRSQNGQFRVSICFRGHFQMLIWYFGLKMIISGIIFIRSFPFGIFNKLNLIIFKIKFSNFVKITQFFQFQCFNFVWFNLHAHNVRHIHQLKMGQIVQGVAIQIKMFCPIEPNFSRSYQLIDCICI